MAETTSGLFCPNCSQAIYFRHSGSNVIVCTCGKRLKKEENFLMVQAFEGVKEVDSAIQPGTEGTWNGKKFTVLGRIRAWMEEFVFNYWTVAFEDGRLWYLGEGYGIYAFYEKIEDARVGLVIFTNERLENVTSFLDHSYFIERKYVCYRWEVEGEILFPVLRSEFTIVEMGAEEGNRIELIEGFTPLAYSVYYESFANLHLTNLREPTGSIKKLTCTECSIHNDIKGYPYVQSYSCSRCGTRYELRDGTSFKKITERNDLDENSRITLGAKGTVRGVEYEVIGFTLKQERNAWQSQWREYTLYNPVQGFTFLSEFEGHWIHLRERGDCPVVKNEVKEFSFNNEPFHKFNAYTFATRVAAGCFPYNIFNDESKSVKEYISPPEIWIQEKSNREGTVWYHGEHISHGELAKAFGQNIILMPKSGVGAVQPKGYVNPLKLASVALLAMLFLIIAHLLSRNFNDQRTILTKTLNFSDTLNSTSLVSQKFTLDRWRSNLLIKIYAPVDNSWFALGANLVNTKTGTEYSIEKGVEYYHGVEDGAIWTEGGWQEEAIFNQVPAGEYQLQIEGSREPALYGLSPTTGAELTVIYDVPNDRNLTYALIAVAAFAVINFLIVRYYERSRWYNSPFTPYTYEE